MIEIKNFLKRLNKEHGFIFSTVVDNTGKVIAMEGSPGLIPSIRNDVYYNFFRDEETIRNTFVFLQNKIMPHSYAQGKRHITLFKPKDHLLVGCLAEDSRSALQMFEESLIIEQEIMKEFM